MEIWQVAIDWIRYFSAKKNSQEQFDTAWASTKAMDLWLEDQYEDLWKLVLVIHSLDQSPKIMAVLSAGPIEDLLGKRGEQFISRVEAQAKSDPAFARVLGGVWKSSMSDEVWARLHAVCDPIGWDDIPE